VFDLSVSQEIVDKGYGVVELIKQKLMDIYYNAEDGHKVHGVIPCQSRSRLCPNVSS